MPVSALSLEKQVIDTVKRTSPSVVGVGTVRLMQDQFAHVLQVPGMGSGVIIDETGYIATNYHVIANTERIVVVLPDGRNVTGKLVGADPTTDIAVVKIDAAKLKAAPLGDSDKLEVGQFAIAIGNPFGMVLRGPTVTIGVVSALKRRIQAETAAYENLIQTDAAINPGNSGGPLVDINGNVIGINTAMIPFAQGIGFAIPINKVKEIVGELITHGKVVRPWIGIFGISLTHEIAAYSNLQVDTGVLVVNMYRGGPAHLEGLRIGDIIIALDGKKVETVEQLQNAIKGKKVRLKVKLTIVREGGRLELPITIEEVPG